MKDLIGQGNALQGASTLTQQLVNQVYLPPKYHEHRDLKYKIVQAKLAEQLESKHPKTWILNNYLNDVPYGTTNGEEAIGVGAAALMFFDKPVWKLNLAQMSLLAGLPQSPTVYNPTIDPKLAKNRRNAVLQAMVVSHDIPQGLANAVMKQPLQIHPNARFIAHTQPYIFDYIVGQLDQKLCPHSPNKCGVVSDGGLKVYSTIDLKRQQQAIDAIYTNRGVNGIPAAALASVDPTNGHVLAIASSATYDRTKFDYPVQAERQTGSAFKAFALMTLIHDYDGDPDSTYYTSKFLQAGWNPLDPTWSVHTAEETYQGTINITKATTVSDNTVFAQLAEDLGYEKLDATAHAMGITSPLNGYPSEVLGGLSNCCTMLEMADAYATLANAGVHVPTTIISKVEFPSGKVMNFGDPPSTRVFTDGEAYAGTKVLKTVIQSGTGTGASYGCPAAGKTGTAQTTRTPGSSATPPSSRPRSGSATRRATCTCPTASAARSRRRSGATTCTRPRTASAATSRRRPRPSPAPRSRARIRRPRHRARLRAPRPAPTSTTRNSSPSHRAPRRPRSLKPRRSSPGVAVWRRRGQAAVVAATVAVAAAAARATASTGRWLIWRAGSALRPGRRGQGA